MRYKKPKKTLNNLKTLTFNKKRILLAATILLISFHVIFALQTITSGAHLASLEKEEEQELKKNKELTNQLVQASSLIQLRERAQDLGFMKPNQTLYINAEDVFAKLP